jgi:uncharacterized damage-inducible protein DinB
MPGKQDLAALYREAYGAMLEALSGLDEAGYRRVPTGAQWSIANALGHAGEAQEFWLSQVELLLKEPGAKVGRWEEDARRARERGVKEDSLAPYGDMLAKFQRVALTGQRRLAQLDSAALERAGLRLTALGTGPASVADIFQQIAEHIQEHADQIESLRGAP